MRIMKDADVIVFAYGTLYLKLDAIFIVDSQLIIYRDFGKLTQKCQYWENIPSKNSSKEIP